MTKSLIISIQPKHLVNILNGNKTLELRKSVPKDYKGWVYIYCTKGMPFLIETHYYEWMKGKTTTYYLSNKVLFFEDILNGKVVARFWFDEYEAYYFNDYQNDYRLLTSNGTIFRNATIPKEKVCLTCVSINDYGKGKMLYTWHIKRLEIFDKPMELSDFYFKGKIYDDFVELKRPPQSWQYVWV